MSVWSCKFKNRLTQIPNFPSAWDTQLQCCCDVLFSSLRGIKGANRNRQQRFLKKMEDTRSYFSGSTDTSVLNIWWHLPLGFKATVDNLIHTWHKCICTCVTCSLRKPCQPAWQLTRSVPQTINPSTPIITRNYTARPAPQVLLELSRCNHVSVTVSFSPLCVSVCCVCSSWVFAHSRHFECTVGCRRVFRRFKSTVGESSCAREGLSPSRGVGLLFLFLHNPASFLCIEGMTVFPVSFPPGERQNVLPPSW